MARATGPHLGSGSAPSGDAIGRHASRLSIRSQNAVGRSASHMTQQTQGKLPSSIVTARPTWNRTNAAMANSR